MSEATIPAVTVQEETVSVAIQADETASPNAEPAGLNFNAILAKFDRACGLQAELNYDQASLAAEYVGAFLKAAPGTAMRSSAVLHLAAVSFRQSDDIFSLSDKEGTVKHAKRVNLLLNVNAVCTLIGDGSGLEKVKGNGRKVKGKQSRLPWGKIRELCPLVERFADDHLEVWGLHLSIAGKDNTLAIDLLTQIANAPALTQNDIRTAVKKIRMEHAIQENDLVEAAKWGYRAPEEIKTAPVPAAEPVDHATETDSLTIVDGSKTDVPATAATPDKDEETIVNGPSVVPPTQDSGTGPKTDCYQGESILHTLANQAKEGTVKDFADLLASSISQHRQPYAVLRTILEMVRDEEIGSEEGQGWLTACIDCYDAEVATK